MSTEDASLAQLVEHHLAKVIVDGSSPLTRSILSFLFSIDKKKFSVFDTRKIRGILKNMITHTENSIFIKHALSALLKLLLSRNKLFRNK